MAVPASNSKEVEQLATRHSNPHQQTIPQPIAIPTAARHHHQQQARASMEAQTPPQPVVASRYQMLQVQVDGSSERSGSQHDMDLSSMAENGKLSSSPPGSYTRIPPRSIDPSVVPPILPPHLLQVILNNPDKANATILPQPNHVMLNHLYALSIKDGIMVLSATHRFRKKYVTTLLYKPI